MSSAASATGIDGRLTTAWHALDPEAALAQQRELVAGTHEARTMHLKPRWHVDVSTGCAMRAAGR